MVIKETSENSPIKEVEELTNFELRVMCEKHGVSKKGGKYQMWRAIQAAKAKDKKEEKPKKKAKK